MNSYDDLMEEYKVRLRKRAPYEGNFSTPISGLDIHRRDAPTTPTRCFVKPEIALLVQGCKNLLVGTEEYFCRENQLLIAGLDLPNTSAIIEVEPGKPTMSMTLELDTALIAQLCLEVPPNSSPDAVNPNGIMIQPLDASILEAFLRLDALLDTPEHISVLAPMIVREIHYRLLVGPDGNQLRALHTFGSQKNQVVRAVSWLNENYSKPLQVEALADMVHMASCTFHRHFKEITSLSPLQYQKRLRLHEAQRLMIMEDLDANSACIAVGYESLPQFTREYKRLFGEPPRRNVTRWQREHEREYSLMIGV